MENSKEVIHELSFAEIFLSRKKNLTGSTKPVFPAEKRSQKWSNNQKKREKEARKTLNGDIASAVSNQARLQPLFQASGWYTSLQMLFNFFERAETVVCSGRTQGCFDSCYKFRALFIGQI